MTADERIEGLLNAFGHTRIDTTMVYMDTSQEDAKMYHSKAI